MEFSLCSAHLPSWVDDSIFEQAIEEVREVGRSKIGGSLFVGVDANCNVDDPEDSRCTLVRALVRDLCERLSLSLLYNAIGRCVGVRRRGFGARRKLTLSSRIK